MREIVLDTETTGLEPSEGHRIVEIGAIELVNHMPTGRVYHEYIDPERDMPEAAFEVHGLGNDFLRGKPVFSKLAKGFLEFVADATLVIHNAAFDMKFLNAELERAEHRVCRCQALTFILARKKFPGSPASLVRFAVDLVSIIPAVKNTARCSIQRFWRRCI